MKLYPSRPVSSGGSILRLSASRRVALLTRALLFLLATTALAHAQGRILLIGGKKSHGPAQHDFPNGIPLFAAQLKSSPTFAGMEVLAFPDAWPKDPSVFAGVTTVVLYFDGVQQVPAPLLDPQRIAQMNKLMAEGAGLVCLHQASTVPTDDNTIPMSDWLGARRNGMFDRSEEKEKVALKPATPGHPVSNGLTAFSYHDEFYPTLIFNREAGRVTSILYAAVPLSAPKDRIVAWAYDRPNGGRSFGFTGGHYLEAFASERVIKKMTLNAIAWTAHLSIPADGVATTEPLVANAVVTKAGEALHQPQPWGELVWYTSAAQKNSQSTTTGLATIHPGQSNPKHFHPNCDETLHVLSGKIRSFTNETAVEMNAGDTITIPSGVVHNATNIGTEDAVLSISYSSADREVVGEAANQIGSDHSSK